MWLVYTFISAVFAQGVDRAYNLDNSDLKLAVTVTPYETSIVEKAPLAIRIMLENRGTRALNIYFKEGKKMRDDDVFRLVAEDESGRRHELRRLVTLIANVGRAPGVPLAPAASLVTDHVMCLHSTDYWDMNSQEEKGYYLPPGRYKLHGVLNCPPEISSEPFELTVLAAEGEDAEVLAQLPRICYYAQGAARYPKPDTKWTPVGPPDEVRAALERIQAAAPTSSFTRWIAYWRAYHGLEGRDPPDLAEAIRSASEFADANPEFPFTDNLLLRLVTAATRVGEPEKARQALQKLRADYPSTDIPASELQEAEEEIAEVELRRAQNVDDD